MTTLASALTNAASVMGQTGTQYLSREFAVTPDAAQKASLEDLVTDLQKIFHRCKKEANRLNTAQKILITLGIIASKQDTPESQAHFAKVKEIAMQALSPEGQTAELGSRAKYLQDKLIILLWAKKLLTGCGQEAHAGISFIEADAKCQVAFEPRAVRDNGVEFAYRKDDDDFSTFAFSALLRINNLAEVEGGPKGRLLTREELLEIDTYCQSGNDEVKKIIEDYALLRKRVVASKLYDKSIEGSNHLKQLGGNNKLMFQRNELIVPCQSLSAYYPAFDNYVHFLTNYGKKISLTELIAMKGFYEQHLTQLPAVHFAYSYFYNELIEVCLLFPSRVDALGYKKAYNGYEGNAFPNPDAFRSIEAVLVPISLPTLPAEEEKKEAPKKNQSASSKKNSSKKSKAAKSKKPPSRNLPPAEPIESERASVSTTTTTTTTNSSTPKVAKEKEVKKLEKDVLPFDEISYDPRVSLWFTNPTDCLSLPGLCSFKQQRKRECRI